MQEQEPSYWGALDRYQAHYIVRMEADHRHYARARLETSGRFGAKKIVSATWEGGRLADVLSADAQLCSMVAALPIGQASITVEPTGNAVRMHGKWQNRRELGITKEAFAVYERIAGHVRELGPPPV